MTASEVDASRGDATAPHLNFARCHRAISSRDPRFDGQFFTAVRTTGVYCRPSCPATTPKVENVTFLPTAAAAHLAGYRACKRCSPDATPGSPQWNLRGDAAARAMRLINDGVVDREGVEGLARRLGYSSRQISRLLVAELGAGPLALARARRAATARTLIQTTGLSFSDIAFAAGFSSIRQFNDTVQEVYAAAPRELRRDKNPSSSAPGALMLRLPFRGPLHAPWLRWFLTEHAVPGIEEIRGDDYRRTVRLPHGPAVICLQMTPADGQILARFQLSSSRDMACAVNQTRRLLDLDADPEAVDQALSAHSGLRDHITRAPGIRLLGAGDPAELLLRTMIGQQIAVASARTMTGELVAKLGEPTTDPDTAGGLSRLFPTAEQIAADNGQSLRGPAARRRAILGAAQALANGKLAPHAGMSAGDLRRQLLELPGVGPWTADYVVLRLLGDPDVLLDTDLVVRRGAEALGIDLKDTARFAPWRSYLCFRLWQHALDKKTRKGSAHDARRRRAS